MKHRLFLCFLFTTILNTSYATIYPMPSRWNDVVGKSFTIKIEEGDTIDTLCEKYEISYHEMLEANPDIKPRKLEPGQKIIIPARFILPEQREGIVVNVSELRLYYFYPDSKYVFTTPVGLGKSGWRTPTFFTNVIRKVKNPTWIVPKSIAQYTYRTTGIRLPPKVPPGPQNPLGKYAIILKKEGFLIHGTNDQKSVGKYASSGCIRLYANAIRTLYDEISVDTPVYIVHHANKAGWLYGRLYLESLLSVSHDEKETDFNDKTVLSALKLATKNRPAYINWDRVAMVSKKQTGIPTVVGWVKRRRR